MPYITTDDVRVLLDGVDLLLRDNEVDLRDEIQAAEAWINGYLQAAGVPTPVSGIVPAFIQQATANYACYVAVRRRNSAGQFTDMMREFQREAYRFRDDYINGLADTQPALRTNDVISLVVRPDD